MELVTDRCRLSLSVGSAHRRDLLHRHPSLLVRSRDRHGAHGLHSERLCCISFSGRSVARCFSLLCRDREDVKELVYEADLVFHTRLTGEAMSSPNHAHYFKALDRGRSGPHHLKASSRTNDSLECTMVGFDVADPSHAKFLHRRSWSVRFARSTRPLAWLEFAHRISMFNSASARPNCVMP